MEKFKTHSIKILIDENSDLHRRIKEIAKLRGITCNAALQEAVDIGVWHHIKANLDLMERLSKDPLL